MALGGRSWEEWIAQYATRLGPINTSVMTATNRAI